MKRHLIDSLGRTQEAVFIPESDVYRLTFGSKLPEAEKFTNWVTKVVLPTIRKTGGYILDDNKFVESYFPYADEFIKTFIKGNLLAARQQNELIEKQKSEIAHEKK